MKDLSNLPEGLRRLETAIKQTASAPARAYYELGEAYLTVGQAAKALPNFEEATKRDPREWRYIFKAGQAAQAGGQVSRAVNEYRRALTIVPEQPNVLAAMGSA